MNRIQATYQSDIFTTYQIRAFEVNIYRSIVSIGSEEKTCLIQIQGRKSTDNLLQLLTKIEFLIFFYLGFFPVLVSIEVNGINQDISERLLKYHTSKQFIGQSRIISNISADTICEQKLQKLSRLHQTGLNSLQYLVSEPYDHVIVDHKMTLLLHVVQGLYDESRLQQDWQYLQRRYKELKGNKIGYYMPSAYWLCDKYFFKYHRKYNCEILPLLKVTQCQFLRRLTDTRNWYSHFLPESEKAMRIRKGQDFVIYFEILYYAIRLSVVDWLGIPLDDDRIREFYYIIHDWVQAIVYARDTPLKSNTYQILRVWEEFKAQIQAEEKTNGIIPPM